MKRPYNFGAGDGVRTRSLSIKSRVLFHMSFARLKMVGHERIELSTFRLRGGCSQPIELVTHLVAGVSLELTTSRLSGVCSCLLSYPAKSGAPWKTRTSDSLLVGQML